MGRRREAPLPVRLEAPPLRFQIQRQTDGVPLRPLQRRHIGDDEADAGDAFQALVAGREQAGERNRLGIDPDRAEAAHGVDVEPPSSSGDHSRHIRQRVQQPRRGFHMHDRHVGDRPVRLQRRRDLTPIDRLVLRPLQHLKGAPDHPADLRHPPAIGAIDEDQQLSVTRDQRLQSGFDGEGAAALDRYAGLRPPHGLRRWRSVSA